MKISKKMMPLAVLVAVVVLLAIALAVLSGLDTEEETGLPLFELDPDSVTAVSYQQQDEEDHGGGQQHARPATAGPAGAVRVGTAVRVRTREDPGGLHAGVSPGRTGWCG